MTLVRLKSGDVIQLSGTLIAAPKVRLWSEKGAKPIPVVVLDVAPLEDDEPAGDGDGDNDKDDKDKDDKDKDD